MGEKTINARTTSKEKQTTHTFIDARDTAIPL